MQIYRTEYPRPQFVRESWQNLNGQWDFCFDRGDSGWQRGLLTEKYNMKINVPFCFESKLSGIGDTDFCAAVWYRREVEISADKLSGRVLLHFGAADYQTVVWVNEKEVCRHVGGYSSFCCDITDAAVAGKNLITVRCRDDNRSCRQPRGKQSAQYKSHACDYTRTTGIWQTVWLEFVPASYISGSKIITNYKSGAVSAKISVSGCRRDLSVRLTASFEGRQVACVTEKIAGENTAVSFTVKKPRLWDVGKPNLYDLKYELLRGGEVIDSADGYFGIRTVEIRGGGFYINGKAVFMRLVLDQGFYPDGVYTAPSDADLIKDIELSMKLGFNGARLHQKVFEERFLYHADKMGYIVWGEHANWGLDISDGAGIENFLPEWLEIMRRDFNHPAIIGWCPFNETWDRAGKQQDDNVLKITYLATKSADPTRPCIDTSGNYHVITDMYDVHDYCQDAAEYKRRYGGSYEDMYEVYPKRQQKNGSPFWISEYGGAWWAPGRSDGWGYGDSPKSEAEVADRFCAVSTVMQKNPVIVGYCYTQLTDIEQEQNGLYTYDRCHKLSDESYARIAAVNAKKTAFEKKNEEGDR